MIKLFFKFLVIVLFTGFCDQRLWGEELSGEDSIGEMTLDSEISDDESDAELSLDSDEIRKNYEYSVSLGAGMAEAWQIYHLSAVFWNESGWHLYTSLGGAKLHYSGKRATKDYEIDIVARSLGVGVRYYFEQFPMFFVQGATGLAGFNGDISPAGDDGSETSSDSLSSGLSATGLWVSQQLGWQTVWESGWNLEIALVGAEKTWLISKTFTRNSAEARTTLVEKIESPYSWGILNLKLGLLF